MATLMNRDSFVGNGEFGTNKRSGTKFENGTIEVTLADVTKRVPAIKYEGGSIHVRSGIGGKYRTGTGKVWPVVLYSAKDDAPGEWREVCYFGRDDRAVKFNKDRIFFTT
jgi:hypothetical protein